MTWKLAVKNLAGRPGRTAALLILSALLAFSVFGGSLLVRGMQKGLTGLTARLGADVIVLPTEAKKKFSVNSILLQGNPGYFYMDRSVLDEIAGREGVERVSAQLYLASVTASCCSTAVQIIGFDPETDFTIQPWMQETYTGTIGHGDILVGSDISVPTDGMLKFFGVECHVVAQLARTGSSLDNAVYADSETIMEMIAASMELGLNQYSKLDPAQVVSAVLVKVQEGYEVEQVKDDINLHVRKVEAVRASNMISGISDGLSGISRLIGLFVGAVWALCLIVMMVTFTMIMNERKKEFAVLRVLGESRGRLAALVLCESLLVSLAGGAIGLFAASITVFPFNRAIERALGVPFIIPGGGRVALLCALTLLSCAGAGALIAALSAWRISRLDTGRILREGS